MQSSKKDYLDGDAVILVPHTAVVYPHVAARHVEAVGVEGGEVDDVVVVLLRPPRAGGYNLRPSPASPNMSYLLTHLISQNRTSNPSTSCTQNVQ